jgi:hypothetical protein
MNSLTKVCKVMNSEEKDPNTMQLREESDPEWVNLWDDCKNKKQPSTRQVTFDIY